jgi:hypothetical protein
MQQSMQKIALYEAIANVALVFSLGCADSSAACPTGTDCPASATNTGGSPDAGGSATRDGGSQTPDASPTLPACSWPSDLEPADSSSRSTCHAARALVSCGTGSGASAMCLSDGAIACSGAVFSEPLTCRDLCQPNQYVAACGGIGPGPVPDPPADCKFGSANPGGIAYYCCPCAE